MDVGREGSGRERRRRKGCYRTYWHCCRDIDSFNVTENTTASVPVLPVLSFPGHEKMDSIVHARNQTIPSPT